MSLKRVPILDSNFSHCQYSTDFQESDYIIWERRFEFFGEEPLVFFTDYHLGSPRIEGKKNIAWLIEPRSISPHVYTYVSQNSDRFDLILTYDRDLLNGGGNFEFYPHGGCWIKKDDWQIYEKSKSLSIIASEKRSTEGHILRHRVIEKIGRSEMDVYGRGYHQIPYKLEALKDYRFSFVIENASFDFYFTEKLIDCLVTGTVPIYYGCPSIDRFFNPDGFIFFKDIEELEEIQIHLTPENYESKKEAILENFKLAQQYTIAEDWIYQKTKIFN